MKTKKFNTALEVLTVIDVALGIIACFINPLISTAAILLICANCYFANWEYPEPNRDFLVEMGWIEEDVQTNPHWDSAIVGASSSFRVIYDETKIPRRYRKNVPDDCVIVEFNDNVEEVLSQHQGALIFESPSYKNAIIGSSNEHIVYDYNKMAECLMEEDNMEWDEALDFIGYNTLRAMPYYPEGPIVLSYRIDEE